MKDGSTTPGTEGANAKRRRRIEEYVHRVGSVGRFYVVLFSGVQPADGGDPVDVLCGPLESAEAADCARRDAVEHLVEHGTATGLFTSADHWNAAGRILRFLRGSRDMTPEEIAGEFMCAKPWLRPVGAVPDDDDTPF